MKNVKKIFGTAIAAAAATVPFLGGHASADQAQSFRDTSVDDAKKVADEAANTPTYTVQSGDTLASISEVTGVSVTDLQRFNKLGTNSLIVTGSQLKLSDGTESSTTQNTAAAQTTATASTNSTAVDSNDSTLAALNAMRANAGLPQLTWDASLAAKAQGRAALVAASGIPADHFRLSTEVIAIGWSAGSSVISAWYNETNMVGAANGHRNWEMNASFTHVGFGYVNGVIVGEAY
ncbi:LysM peptidoglycan-binding domain-containing protein [Weissella diestrammenae]|uniref:LysM peptidoglycan-binding domain-containing protein n=1 Tax=Weissella diestrammenae TaxID=1162633 RepID=A0A7G9T678_9LACO|nr:CAP domain-containing protein [Weissella diestrammenae]MCM0583353.1 LysM peptidoglycan-binding domain-containing protein [Weissella diestrammenae]QNN75603.1 LysM peptidoglycan-binding domain-containing protein [Weissella diestrammenae]